MKVEQKEAEFEPVVITLESQEEVDIIADLLAIAANNSLCMEDEDMKELARNMNRLFDKYASSDFELAVFHVPDDPLKYK